MFSDKRSGDLPAARLERNSLCLYIPADTCPTSVFYLQPTDFGIIPHRLPCRKDKSYRRPVWIQSQREHA